MFDYNKTIELNKKIKGAFEIMEMKSLKCGYLGGTYINCVVEGAKVIAFQEWNGVWRYVYDMKNIGDERGISISKFKHNKKYIGVVHSENFLLKCLNERFKNPLYVDEHGHCNFKPLKKNNFLNE